jgi:eukaryotic-like serine/threonine-protein kinase
MALTAGDRTGPYELIRLLGAGGMGQVWLASEPRLGRNVALKFLPDELKRNPERVARFEREARAASALSHPNVCHIYALGETNEGQQFIAMEMVEGQTLRDRLRSWPMPLREALGIGIQVAAALDAAHAANIVHRDLKPENVMVRPDGVVKVLDFGLAKLVRDDPDIAAAETTHTVATNPGTVVGTFAYMSPEQARGQQVDARTDIWSLAVVLYEMVAGRAPFVGQSSSDVLAAILTLDPAPLARFQPETPPELQRIIVKALRKDREHRYQSARDLLLDLEALRDELHAQSRSGSRDNARAAGLTEATGGKRWAFIPRGLWATIAVVSLGAAAALTTVWWTGKLERARIGARANPIVTRLTANPTTRRIHHFPRA